MKPLLLLLSFSLALAACTRREAVPTPAQREAAAAARMKFSTRLSELVRGSRAAGPCAAVVAQEWSEGYPVPAEAAKGRTFKLFFYALEGAPPDEPAMYAPSAEALLDLGTGRVSECALTTGKPAALPGHRWPASLAGIGVSGHEALDRKLYDRTEAVSAVYGSASAPSPADVDLAKDYVRLFKITAEPSLLPYYYRLNPAFWEWLRIVAGDSLPPAR